MLCLFCWIGTNDYARNAMPCYCEPVRRGNLLGKNAVIFTRWLLYTSHDVVFDAFILEEKNNKSRQRCEDLIKLFS